jgi:hypothetical protein
VSKVSNPKTGVSRVSEGFIRTIYDFILLVCVCLCVCMDEYSHITQRK